MRSYVMQCLILATLCFVIGVSNSHAASSWTVTGKVKPDNGSSLYHPMMIRINGLDGLSDEQIEDFCLEINGVKMQLERHSDGYVYLKGGSAFVPHAQGKSVFLWDDSNEDGLVSTEELKKTDLKMNDIIETITQKNDSPNGLSSITMQVTSIYLGMDFDGNKTVDTFPGSPDALASQKKSFPFWVGESVNVGPFRGNVQGKYYLDDLIPIYIGFGGKDSSGNSAAFDKLKKDLDQDSRIVIRFRKTSEATTRAVDLFCYAGKDYEHIKASGTKDNYPPILSKLLDATKASLTYNDATLLYRKGSGSNDINNYLFDTKNGGNNGWFLLAVDEDMIGPGLLEVVLYEMEDNVEKETIVHKAPTDFKKIEDMYTIADSWDPNNNYDFTVPSIALLPAIDIANKDVTVFVHGLQPSTESSAAKETAKAAAEIYYKRLYHTGYRGRFVLFTWDSFGKLSAGEIAKVLVGDLFGLSPADEFNKVVFKGLLAGDKFKGYLAKLNDNSSVDKIHVVAHSLGNIVASNAIIQGESGVVDSYILTEAAVAAGAYNPSAPKFAPLVNEDDPEIDNRCDLGIFTSVKDKTNMINTYSPADSILYNDTPLAEKISWVANGQNISMATWQDKHEDYRYDFEKVNAGYADYAFNTEPVTKPAGLDTVSTGADDNINAEPLGVDSHTGWAEKYFYQRKLFFDENYNIIK